MGKNLEMKLNSVICNQLERIMARVDTMKAEFLLAVEPSRLVDKLEILACNILHMEMK